jgi:PIN domain nuclease of toxin-antitoxin system
VDLLIDTHTFLWYVIGDPQLSDTARSYIDNKENNKYLSVASLWEIAIKSSIGKLKLVEPYETLIPRLIQVNKIQVLSLSIEHTVQVANMGFPDSKHRDPFDRLIIAQSKVENIPIISRDTKFDTYGINRLW